MGETDSVRTLGQEEAWGALGMTGHLVTFLGEFLVTGPTPRPIVIMSFGHPADTSAGETGIRCKEMVLDGAEAVEDPVLKTL